MHRVVYILSASHSGTTLMAMLLGAHPQACTIGELKLENLGDIDSYRCSCGAPIISCDFWARIQKGMRDQQCDFTLSDPGTSVYKCPGRYPGRFLVPLHRGRLLETTRDVALSISPTWRRHLARVKHNYRALVTTTLEVTGAQVLVDSSKQALQLKYLLQIPGLDVRVLWFVRDGRAVALTGVDKASFADATDPSLRYGGSGKHDGFPSDSMVQATRNWRRSNEAADSLLDRLEPSRWMKLHYEDLCADPGAVLGRACQFLDLDPGKIRLDFRSAGNHVVGNGMRLDNTSCIQVDERWRNHLTPADLQVFDQEAGGLNRSHGYA
jgi:hypothetical protein